MKYEILDTYKRRGTKVNITCKAVLNKTMKDSEGEEYDETYSWLYIEYKDGKWILDDFYYHEDYPIPESEKWDTEEIINCFINSSVYRRIKKAMKIK